MESGIRRIVDDLSAYYLIGYYSTAEADGRFHNLTVTHQAPGRPRACALGLSGRARIRIVAGPSLPDRRPAVPT